MQRLLRMRQTPGSQEIIGRPFYERDTVSVARGLLGQVLHHGSTSGRIVEVEAYLPDPNDRAAHSSHGLTERTRIIFGPPGHAYVYLIYGIHECLNVVAEPAGVPGCVLIRAVEPLTGIETMRRRRGGNFAKDIANLKDLANGPGKLTTALGITRKQYGLDLTQGPLTIRAATQEGFEIETTTRIGIRECRDWPLRFYIKGNMYVSKT